jgi:hypothetical protein
LPAFGIKVSFWGIPKSGLQDILSPTTLNHTKLQCWQVMTVGITKPEKKRQANEKFTIGTTKLRNCQGML